MSEQEQTVLSETELEDIEEYAQAATPGPWQYDNDYTIRVPNTPSPFTNEPPHRLGSVSMFNDPHDGTFIANSRTDVPRLIASHRALAAQLKEREEEAERMIDAVEAADTLADEVQDAWRTTDIGMDQFPWNSISKRFHEYELARAMLNPRADAALAALEAATPPQGKEDECE